MEQFIKAFRLTLQGRRKLNEKRKYQACGFVLALVHLIFTILFYRLDIEVLYIYNAVVVVFYTVIAVITVRVSRHTYIFIATFIEILIHSMLVSLMLGWDWGFMTYTMGLVPLSYYITYTVEYFRRNILIPVISSAIVFACYIFVRYSCRMNGPLLTESFPEDIQYYTYLFNMTLTFLMLWSVAMLFSLEVNYMQRHLEVENITLELLANYDPLTSLLNRRSMDSYLKDAVRRARNECDDVCVIMADLDDFKKVNDTYGHAAGDRVLIEAAGIVTSDIRDKDCACRWGGEEILILLRTSRDTAVSVAERICRDISKCVINCGEDSISVTVTLGVAQLRDDDTMDTFVARADECLYKGKNSGKNQVVSDIGMH